MARQLFINPKDTDRLYLWPETEGREYWIDVKRKLSTKESQAVQSAGVNHMNVKAQTPGDETPVENTGEVKLGLDMGAMKLKRAEQYIVAWSFTRPTSGGAEVPVPVNAETIGDTLPEVFAEIERQLDLFIAQQAAAKNAPAGATTSLSDSASVA